MSLAYENVVLNKWVFDDAERAFYTKTAVTPQTVGTSAESSIKQEFGKLKATLRAQIGSAESAGLDLQNLLERLNKLEVENKQLKEQVQKLEGRVNGIEKGAPSTTKTTSAPTPAPAAQQKAESKDDDFDLFADDDEDSEEKKRITEERLKAYADKKNKKPALIAKSTVILDVKPWDDETDLAALEKSVRSVEMEGLLWGTSKLVPVAFGVKKLQITCVIEDDKVSTEVLEEKICEFEDYVQSVDIVSFNKI